MQKSTHTAEYRALIDALVTARQRAGLTQQALADRLGKPQSFVAKFENRERRLDVVEFVAICRSVGADPSSIISTVFR